MHIRHVNLARDFRGGERQTVLLILALAAHGIEQSLVCRADSPMRQELEGLQTLTFITAAHPLAGQFQGPRADLVHAHEARAVHWAWLHRQLRRTPYLLTRRVPQPVRDKPFNRRTYGDAAMAVAISSPIEAHLNERHWCPVERIPSALSHLPRHSVIGETLKERFSGRFVVGHVGALVDRHKGQRLIIEAARRLRSEHPDLLFVLLGEGEDGEALREESRDLDNVLWEGFQPHVGDYLAAFDLFVFPSRNEGLGSTLLDAMDAGVPIIASRVDGIPDIVIDGRTGVLIPPDDATTLSEQIVALRHDPAQRTRLVGGARQRLAEFTPEAMGDAYLALYQRLLAPA
nr:glycosyltransferase family 4 protein [Kushneria sinocarnis]